MLLLRERRLYTVLVVYRYGHSPSLCSIAIFSNGKCQP